MDGFGYGGFSQSPYPYFPPYINPTSSQSASAPPIKMNRPVESYGPTEEMSDPMNFYGYSHRSLADWPYNSGHLGVDKSPSSSSLVHADNTRSRSCGSRGENSYQGMFSPSDMFTSMEVSSASSVHAHGNLYEKHRSPFVPIYKSATLVPGSSSTAVHTCYSQEPSVHSHHSSYNDFEVTRAVSSYPVEPVISSNIALLPVSSLEPRASFDDTQIRFHLGYEEPLPGNSSVSKDVVEKYLGGESNLKSSCIAPVNFDALLGAGIATTHSQPLSAGLGLHNLANGSSCLRGPCASQSPEFDVKSSDSFLGSKPEVSSVAFVHPRPKALVGDLGKDALGCSSKNTCENSKANESRYWDQFMVPNSEGPSVSKLLSVESQSCDSMRVEYGNGESAFSHITNLSDYAGRPSREDVVQANQEPHRSREQIYSEDKMNVDKSSKAKESSFWDHYLVSSSQGPSAYKLFSKEHQSCDPVIMDCGIADSALSHTACLSDNTNKPSGDDAVQANRENIFSEDKMNVVRKAMLLADQGLKERRSEAEDVSNHASPGRHACSLQDLQCPTSSPKVSLVVNAMQNLSELLVYECCNDGSYLKKEDLETLQEVVKNLTKCLKEFTRCKIEAEEATVQKQAMPVPSPNMVPKVGIADFQGHYVKPSENRYGGYAFTEMVNKDEMTQNIKSILAANFPDNKEAPPEAALFKNLWLEAEAALCSSTYMARFYRIRNEIENRKFLDTGSSTNASSSRQEPSVNLQKLVPITKIPEPQTTESLVEESHENNAIKMSHVNGGWGLNLDSVDALLAFVSGSFLGSSEQGSHVKLIPDANYGKIPSALSEETSGSNNTNSHVNDVMDRFQILKRREAKDKHESLNNFDSHSNPDSDNAVQVTDGDKKSGQISKTPTCYSPDNQEASGETSLRPRTHANDVMERFQILKGREAELEQKSLNRLDSDSDRVVELTATDNISTLTQEVPIHDAPDNVEAPVVARLRVLRSRADHMVSETCEGTDDVKEDVFASVHGTEPSGRGHEGLLEWEHVLKDEFVGPRG